MSDLDRLKREIRELCERIKKDKGIWRAFRRWRDKLVLRAKLLILAKMVMGIED